MNRVTLRTVTLILASLAGTGVTMAQFTVFTYQGRLTEAGQPAAGQHDFRFRLFDAGAGGAQLGATQCVDNLQVTGGVFTATLDFGPQFTTPAERFIEVEVRRDTGLGCANPVGFVPLAPRQRITPAPLATHAGSAFALAAADGSPANAVFVDNDGNVGIGTATPGSRLEVAAQDAITVRGFEPQVTFRDTNAGSARAIIRAVGGAFLNFFTEQSLAGGAPPLQVHNDGISVAGDIRLGAAGEFHAAAAAEPFRIVRGGINGSALFIVGEGFSAVRTGTGIYRITFDTPFGFQPVVTATPLAFPGIPEPAVPLVSGLSGAGVTLELRRSTDGAPVDMPVRFIAIGLR